MIFIELTIGTLGVSLAPNGSLDMRPWIVRLLIALAAVGASSEHARAADALVAIPDGISRIDFDGDGRQEIVVRAWRENFNAHGFSVLSFYFERPDRQASVEERSLPASLGVIAVERLDREGFTNSVSTEEGAECMLRDFRLLQSGGEVMLLAAERPFGSGYDDTQAVLFTVYALTRNEEGLPGLPDAYFAVVRQYESERAYCDAGDALQAEGNRRRPS
jgi:hypothetical protein